MGGFGSGGHNRRRESVENAVRLDCSMLRRAGVLASAGSATWAFGTYNGQVCQVTAERAVDGSLLVTITTPKRTTHQAIGLVSTPCNYGGTRTWMLCPDCGRRVHRTFYNPHAPDNDPREFSCRICAGLTYELRRQRDFKVWELRVQKLIAKVVARGGSAHGQDAEVLPRRPKWMHGRTYNQFVARHELIVAEIWRTFDRRLRKASGWGRRGA